MIERHPSATRPLARRSVIASAGIGLGAAFASRLAQAQIAPEAAPQAAVQQDFWTAEYWAKKADVSLYLWRKRASEPKPARLIELVAHKLRSSCAEARRIFDHERVRARRL
jgi:hypothetical protein